MCVYAFSRFTSKTHLLICRNFFLLSLLTIYLTCYNFNRLSFSITRAMQNGQLFFPDTQNNKWIEMLLRISLWRHMTNWITEHVILVCFVHILFSAVAALFRVFFSSPVFANLIIIVQNLSYSGKKSTAKIFILIFCGWMKRHTQTLSTVEQDRPD